MIALIDYGAGNLTSVRKALAHLDAPVFVPRSAGDLDASALTGVIVPGVGNFEATRALDTPWRTAIVGALERGVTLFGICLGMQWLFDGSDEAPALPGLGLFSGRCVRLDTRRPGDAANDAAAPLKVPHVGWNTLDLPRPTDLMQGIGRDAQVYFTHSYAAPVVRDAAALTTYGEPFAAAVERGRVAGVQFHPEKSGDVGLRILKNWLEKARSSAF